MMYDNLSNPGCLSTGPPITAHARACNIDCLQHKHKEEVTFELFLPDSNSG